MPYFINKILHLESLKLFLEILILEEEEEY